MKTRFLIILFLPSYLFAQIPQPEFYAMRNITWPIIDSSDWGLFRIVSPFNETELVNTLGYTNNYLIDGPMTIDPVNKIFFGFIKGEKNPELHTVNMDSGEELVLMEIPEYSYVVDWTIPQPMMHYNLTDGYLYSILEEKPFQSDLFDSTWLIRIDPFNNLIDTLLDLPPGNYFGVYGGIAPLENKLYYWIFNAANYKIELLTIDLNSLSISTASIPIFSEYAFFALCLDACNHCLYGLGERIVNDEITDPEIFKINLQDNSSEVLAQFQGSMDGCIYLDPNNQVLYMSGFNLNSGSPTMFTYEILSDKVKVIENRTANESIIFTPIMDTVFASIEYENVCQMYPTSFFSTGNGTEFIWDFGDPQSGILNTSHVKIPEHMYLNAGTYMVQLIVSNCYGTDTITKEITIQPFPEINLGNDSVLCANMVNDMVEIELPEIDGDIVWQDGTESNTYIINAPGTYSVTVVASCGIIKDSIEFNSTNCLCEINLHPSLLNYETTFYSSCSIENYLHPAISFYNQLGEKVLTEEIVSTTQTLNLSKLPSGIYYYSFNESEGQIKTGKICISK